ncbi:hypothetical protein Caka_0923 [Coraliomargarita akajimensis DSM 45221]|uniref:Uncharacterized protein n=1 Tax=Coraliomargarita akajimensis (strain DSM 45221 / IAM 15411 / JCM 23193 / KCTC 12865 / 04OKA010-24) TaxID=583355 RepID=D5EQV2_CORAD|nr:hypothetical protein Caka_0923 [Coraliomargarita akajimensis DSM 45221]
MIEKERFVSLAQCADQIESPLARSHSVVLADKCPLSGGCSLLSTASLRKTPMMRIQASVINLLRLTILSSPSTKAVTTDYTEYTETSLG